METLHSMKYLIQENNYLSKVDLKDAYFSIPLHKDSRKYVRFAWSGNLYEFLCLCFGLDPAPNNFIKLLKIPIALLRRLNIRLIIYLDDILLMGKTLREILKSRDTLIFVLQRLGFVINQKKTVLRPNQHLGFLGMLIDTRDMSVFLTQEKLEKTVQKCCQLYQNPSATVLDLQS